MKNIIVRTPELLKGGIYLSNTGKIEFSLVPILFSYFTFDKMPDRKNIVKECRAMVKGKVKDVSNISPDVFSTYWFIDETNKNVKVNIYVKSESFDVNSYLSYLKAITLSMESVNK